METACCNLGKEYLEKKNILFESDNFFITPTIGPIETPGYLLICSKKHYVGICGTPKKLYPELTEVTQFTERILQETYGKPTLAFEHGPLIGACSGGNCLDHAHLHVLPLEEQIMETTAIKIFKGLNTGNSMKITKIKGFKPLADLWEKQSYSYFFTRQKGEEWTTEVNMHLPSQYIRQIIASTKKTKQWDWKEYPGNEIFEQTMETLSPIFH